MLSLFTAENRGCTIFGRVKDEYDFSKAERGRFFRPGAVLVPPKRQDKDPLPKGNVYDTK
jgi:hypothetical protein